MKYIRRYNNAKIKDMPGWKTYHKKSHIEIMDDKNNIAIAITFGRKPKIKVFELLDLENFGRRLQ